MKWAWADAVILGIDALVNHEITPSQLDGYVNQLWAEMERENSAN